MVRVRGTIRVMVRVRVSFKSNSCFSLSGLAALLCIKVNV